MSSFNLQTQERVGTLKNRTLAAVTLIIFFTLMLRFPYRWLPTVLARVHKKITINVALGFDTYLAMRHGFSHSIEEAPNLGCYFCNDAAAELHDSMKDRTLDQQCTVTRPGLTGVASSMGTELLVGLLHHPEKGLAPADAPLEMEKQTKAALGLLPHQIRGSMKHFNSRVLHADSFDRCIACSTPVVKAYVERKMEFCNKVMQDTELLVNRYQYYVMMLGAHHSSNLILMA